MHDLTNEISSRHMDGLYWMEEANRNKIDADLAAANLGYADDEAGRQRLDSQHRRLAQEHARRLRPLSRHDRPPARARQLFDEVLRKSAVWEEIVHQQIGRGADPGGRRQ